MGGALGGLFGSHYSAPEIPKIEPAPVKDELEPVGKEVREAERRKIRARQGLGGTVLTSPLGTSTRGTGILGKIATD